MLVGWHQSLRQREHGLDGDWLSDIPPILATISMRIPCALVNGSLPTCDDRIGAPRLRFCSLQAQASKISRTIAKLRCCKSAKEQLCRRRHGRFILCMTHPLCIFTIVLKGGETPRLIHHTTSQFHIHRVFGAINAIMSSLVVDRGISIIAGSSCDLSVWLLRGFISHGVEIAQATVTDDYLSSTALKSCHRHTFS